MPTTRRGLGLAALSFAAAPARAAAHARVDCHTHSFVPGLPRAADARYAPDYDASYDRLLALAEANGIGRVVITQPSFLGHDNSYLFEALRARPDRLRGVPWIAPGTSAAQWDAMARIGVHGLRFPIFGLPTPDWADYRETFAEAKRRGWTLDLYVESRRLPEVLPAMLDSGAEVIVPHMGMFDRTLGPRHDPGFRLLLEAARTGRAYVKLSGAYRIGVEAAREAAAMVHRGLWAGPAGLGQRLAAHQHHAGPRHDLSADLGLAGGVGAGCGDAGADPGRHAGPALRLRLKRRVMLSM